MRTTWVPLPGDSKASLLTGHVRRHLLLLPLPLNSSKYEDLSICIEDYQEEEQFVSVMLV